jgi:very-short-patch-repair endonuclease
VEVDGYHHFRDVSAYRRDRDKDVVLQQIGYTVLRVLASDVEQELSYVLEKIDAAVEHRRKERSDEAGERE